MSKMSEKMSLSSTYPKGHTKGQSKNVNNYMINIEKNGWLTLYELRDISSHFHLRSANLSANLSNLVRSYEKINNFNELFQEEIYLDVNESANLLGISKRKKRGV